VTERAHRRKADEGVFGRIGQGDRLASGRVTDPDRGEDGSLLGAERPVVLDHLLAVGVTGDAPEAGPVRHVVPPHRRLDPQRAPHRMLVARAEGARRVQIEIGEVRQFVGQSRGQLHDGQPARLAARGSASWAAASSRIVG
jgi:hypothetical protein